MGKLIVKKKGFNCHMEKVNSEILSILNERFHKDSLVSLATSVNNQPYVRTVDAFFEEDSFYVITYALSDKMKQIEVNPRIGLSGEWFSAKGIGENLGYFHKKENREIAKKLQVAFSCWIDNVHNNFQDENTIILKIKLTEGILFSHGKRFDIDFTK